MRNPRVRRNTPTVIVQQAAPTYQTPEVVERKLDIDPKQFLQQLGQMIIQQQVVQEQPQTMTVKEAAKYLRISEWLLYDMVRKDQIPSFKVRSKIFFRQHDLEGWISQNTSSCGLRS